jgi:hypothetical protein
LIEGKFDRHFGKGKATRLKGAIAAAMVFGMLLRASPAA